MALTDNLVAFWEMEEASGTRNDSVGTNHLTDHNTVTQQTGKVGNAAQITAANSEYLDIATNTNIEMGDIDFSVQAWVYLDNKSTFRWIGGKYGALGNREWYLIYSSSSDRFEFRVFDNANLAYDAVANNLGSPSAATWYHIIAWQEVAGAGSVNIAVNAGTPDSITLGGAVVHAAGTYALEFGQSTQLGTQYDGRIDQVGLWKRALTSQDRTDLYNGGAGLSYAAMIGGVGVLMAGRTVLDYD